MRRVGILMLDGAFTAGVGAITDMLALANRFVRRQYADREDRGVTVEVRLLSVTGAPCRTAEGRRLEVDGALADRQAYDLIYVAAFDVADEAALEGLADAHAPVCAWLKALHAGGTAIAVAGAAVLLAAEAGLLDGKRIAAPWWLEGPLKQRRPAVTVEPGLAVSSEGDILCAAGLAADAELAIRLIERLLSPNVADWVSKLTLVKRAGAEPLPWNLLPPEPLCHDPAIERARHWLQERFAEKPRMPDLAEFLEISERTLARRFEKSLGMTPLAYLQALRVTVAKGMLTRSDQKIERIAYLVGYADPKFFKRVFRTQTGLTPSAFRRQMRAANQAASAPRT